jgi:hypothetical protein
MDYSSTSSAKVKNARSYNSNPPHVFIIWYLVKHRGFTIPFNLKAISIVHSPGITLSCTNNVI